MSYEKDDTSTSTKWKVYSGFQCEHNYRDWEDELFARLRLKRIDYLVSSATYNVEPPTNQRAAADEAQLRLQKDYSLAMSIFFDMTSELPRKMIRRATVPYKALKDLREKYLEGKSDDDYVELVVLWENLKPIAKEADPDGLLDLMMEINERMTAVHVDLKKAPIEFYVKYKRLLHKDYDPCIVTFNLARSLPTYRPIIDTELDEFSRTVGNYWKAHFKREDTSIVDKAAIYNLSSNGNKCDYCGKSNHNAFKDGKPFCFKLIKDLKGASKSEGGTTNSSKKGGLFCKYCKSSEHEVDECPKLAKKRANKDTGLNHLFIGSIEVEDECPACIPRSDSSDEYESNSDSDSDSSNDTMPVLKSRESVPSDSSNDECSDMEPEFHVVDCYVFNINTGALVEVLGDSGAAMHVWPSDRTGSRNKTAFMANGAKCEINDIRDVHIQDELGTSICLRNAHSVKGVSKRIISINALRKDGWKLMENGNPKFTSLEKNNCRITFTEKENNLHYLQAVQTSEGINNIDLITPGNLPSTLTKNNTPAVLSDSDDEAETKISDAKARAVPEESTTPAVRFSDDSKPIAREKSATPSKCPTGYKSMDINLFHDLHGHDGMARMKAKAKHLRIHLTGTLNSCDACLAVKSKAKPIQRKTSTPATVPNEQMFLDTTGPFKVRTGTHGRLTNLFLFGLSDKFSSKMLFGFGNEKTELINFVKQSWEVCKGRNLAIKNINMDNAGENLAVENFCRKNNVGYKFTPPDTPKLNGQIERQFAIRLQKAMVLMINAGLNEKARSNKTILMESIKMGSFLYDECPQADEDKSPNQKWYSDDYKVRVKSEHYIQFGRIGFVINKRTHVKKNETRGTAMMMVGYALNSPSGTYRMYNPKTNAIIETNSVGWKDFSKFEDESVTKLKNQPHEPKSGGKVTVDDDDSDDDVTHANDIVQPPSTTATATDNQPSDTPFRRVTRSMTAALRAADSNTVPNATIPPSRAAPSFDAPTDQPATTPNFIVTGDTEPTKLNFGDTSPSIHHIYTPDLIATFEKYGGIDTLIDAFLFHTCIQNDPGTPMTWKEAATCAEREYWLKSMTSEFNNFISRGAWQFVPMSEVKAKGRKVIPTKLVFKLKDEIDGSIRFKTRNVTLGYMMVPGVDFTERFSPVATDGSLKLQIAVTLFYTGTGWTMENCDVEAAFLESDMENDLYIEPHPALVLCGFMTEEERKNYAIKLTKSMYGNVDAAIKFFKTLVEVVTEEDGMNMKQSDVDPCLFYLHKDDKLKLIVTVTVDDCAISGLPEDIKWFMDGLESRFKITRGGKLKKHLGVDYVWGYDEEKQKHYVKATMDKKVQASIEQLKKFLKREIKVKPSPGKPNEYLQKSEDENPVDIDEYRSLVGQIMFFTTKLCPKTGNACRALSGFMSNPSKDHWKALERLIGYMKGMGTRGIIYWEPESMKLIAVSDTDFANCLETRRSVGCNFITIGGCLVDYSMAKHNSLSDSTTEAEYKELAKTAKCSKFVLMLQKELKLADLPGILFEDNTGAIFLSENLSVNKRTKHIDIKHHFIREFIRDGYGKVYKISSEDCIADIGTKNQEVSLFIKHETEIDDGFPTLRNKVYGKDGIIAKDFGGMSE